MLLMLLVGKLLWRVRIQGERKLTCRKGSVSFYGEYTALTGFFPQDYVQALTGFCYDGVEGLIYLVLFSFVTALMFSSIVCSVPHTWQQKRYV